MWFEGIVGNGGYNYEEQEHPYVSSFYQYQYDMDIGSSVLEEMDVYILINQSNFILIPLLEDYIPDFRHWGWHYKLVSIGKLKEL